MKPRRHFKKFFNVTEVLGKIFYVFSKTVWSEIERVRISLTKMFFFLIVYILKFKSNLTLKTTVNSKRAEKDCDGFLL